MAEEPPRGSSYAIKLMYVCMYFKQRFYRPVTVLESLKRFLHIIVRRTNNMKKSHFASASAEILYI